MADTSRKRSRKTKLVLRQCVETDEDHVSDLQMKPAKITRREIISNTIYHIDHDYLSFNENNSILAQTMANQQDDFERLIDEETANSKAAREFSVSVAIEKYDDDSSSDLVIVEPEYEEPHTIVDESSSDEAEITTSIVDCPTVFADEIMGQHCISRDEVLATTNKIMEESTNIADKLLGIEVKNCLGHFQRYIQSPLELKFQRVLNQWLGWQRLIDRKYRSSPLFYKCYICELSWWYLSDFREHLKIHSNYKLDLEEYTIYEANVIAYASVDDIVDIKHFHTEGNCPKCENEYVIHKTTVRLRNRFYSCKVVQCKKVFPTCFALAAHENTYHSITELTGSLHVAIKWRKICEVCGLSFNTHASYQSHMILMHSVRSDVVVALVRYKKCFVCKCRYLFQPHLPAGYQHGCPKKGILGKCDNCFRTFPQTPLYKLHMDAQGHRMCQICNVTLPKWCMETEHLMEHTDKFELVKKCVVCNNFVVFRTAQAASFHESTRHADLHRNFKTTCFDTILIPKTCLGESSDSVGLTESGVRSIIRQDKIVGVEGIKEELLTESGKKPVNKTETPVLKIKQENIDNPIEAPVPEIKQENSIEAPILTIKQEIIDEFQPKNVGEASEVDDYDEYDDPITIKQEGTFEENSDHNEYCIKEEELELQSKIFGVAIEPGDVKQEMQVDAEESEYEDDIIRLDYNFMQDEEINNTQDAMQDNEQNNPGIAAGRRPRKLYKCCKCGFKALHREYREHTKNECLPIYEQLESYTCSKCSTSYEDLHGYVKHFTKHGFDEKCCPVCFRYYATDLALVTHVEEHIKMRFYTVKLPDGSPGTEFKCKLCLESVEKCVFFMHWEEHLTLVEKNKVKTPEAETVINKPIEKRLIQELIHRLQSREYSTRMQHTGCIICHRFFARKNDCKRHLIEHLLNDAYAQRPENRALICQICGRAYSKAESYKQHMRDHASLPVYRCELCDKSFSDSSNFAKHKKLHNRDAYTCDLCGRKFQAKHSIEKHMEVHQNEKPISCEPCNKVFHLTSAYKKHCRMKHSRRKGQYRCMVCAVRFDSLKAKWDHMWLVHKERQHKADCPHCSQSYRRFRDLSYHMKIEHRSQLKNLKVGKATTSRQRIQLILKTAKIKGAGGRKETLIVY